MSFHRALLGSTGAHWLDDLPDVSCKESTRRYAVDGSPLSCNLLACRKCPTTPRPWHRCLAAASGWSPTTSEPDRRKPRPSSLARVVAGAEWPPYQVEACEGHGLH